MQWCSDATYREDLYRRRYDPHVRPVNELVDQLRKERNGAFVPYVAPTYGGVNARLLALLQDPGPKTSTDNHNGSGMLCIENADPTAERYKALLAAYGIDASDIQAWNAFAWSPTTERRGGDRVLAPTDADLHDSTDALARLVRLLPRLRVVLLHGNPARDAWSRLTAAHPDLTAGIEAIASWHPRADSPAYRTGKDAARYTRQLTASFAAAADHLRHPDQEYAQATRANAFTTDASAAPEDPAERPTWRSTLNELRARFVALRTQESSERPPTMSPEPPIPTGPAKQTIDLVDFDREIEQYRIVEAALLAQRRSVQSRMEECRDSRERREDYQQLSEQAQSLGTRLAALERAEDTHLRRRQEVVAWAKKHGESTDNRVFRGSIVTIRYSDGEEETFVLTERDVDTEYETVSHESTLGALLKHKRVGDSAQLANGDYITVTAIQPGFRMTAPTR